MDRPDDHLTPEEPSREHIALRASGVSLAGNILLSGFKLVAGLLANSGAMVSDAVHSLSDVLSTLVVMVGVSLAGRTADEDHQYGHERFESVAAILLAAMLAVTGGGIGLSGIRKIISAGGEPLVVPGILALVAALVSIVLKEAMFWYTRRAAKRINSGALMADAWHHRTDALSSVGSFIGILGARMGFAVLDPLASVVICVFILKAALDIFLDAVGKMTDRACDPETVEAIHALVAGQPGVEAVDLLQTRVFGDRVYVDIEIAIHRDTPLHLAHDVAQGVHDAVESHFSQVKHCMVHMNPTGEL